jgi:hypothetical protein
MMTMTSNWQARPIAELPTTTFFFFLSSLIFGAHTRVFTQHVIIIISLYREDTDRWLLCAKQDPGLRIRRIREKILSV